MVMSHYEEVLNRAGGKPSTAASPGVGSVIPGTFRGQSVFVTVCSEGHESRRADTFYELTVRRGKGGEGRGCARLPRSLARPRACREEALLVCTVTSHALRRARACRVKMRCSRASLAVRRARCSFRRARPLGSHAEA